MGVCHGSCGTDRQVLGLAQSWAALTLTLTLPPYILGAGTSQSVRQAAASSGTPTCGPMPGATAGRDRQLRLQQLSRLKGSHNH